MKKRILSILLALAMVLSVMPFSVFAVEGDVTEEETPEVSYASGLEDTASYAMKIPDDVKKNGGTTYYHTDCGNGHDIPAVEIDGEWFIKFGQKTFQQEQINASIRASKITYGYDGEEGAPEMGVPESVDMSKVKYIAIRIRTDARNKPYTLDNARVRPFLNWVDSTGAKKQSGLYSWSRTSEMPLFLDLDTGALVQWPAQDGWHTKTGLEFTGSINGYYIYPLANSSIDPEMLQSTYKTIQFFFDDAAGTSSKKESDWDDMDFLVGDSFFVEDAEAFAKARTVGIEKYSAGNGAYYGAKTPKNQSVKRGYYISLALSKDIYTGANSTATSGMGNVHIASIANGDVAYELRLNPEKTKGSMTLTTNRTWEGAEGDYTKSNQEFYSTPGFPAELKLTDMTHVALRFAVKGGVEGQGSNIEPMWTGDKTIAKGTEITLIDAVTGEKSIVTYDAGIKIYGDFDGYAIYPLSAYSDVTMDETAAASFAGISMYLRYGDWSNGRTLYAGDQLFVKDINAFMLSIAVPSIEYTATNDTITVTNVEEGALYSIDGETWNATGVFTGLEKDVKYTLYAKFEGGAKTITGDAWTAPFSTHVNDTAYYYMRLPMVEAFYNKNNSGLTGWGSSTIHKNSSNTAYVNGNAAGFFTKIIDGEVFIEFDYNDANTGEANTVIDHFGLTYDAEYATHLGVDETIDTSKINYMAFRIKIENLTEEAKAKQAIFGLYDKSGILNGFLKAEGAVLVDYATRSVIDPEWTGGNMVFTDDFDGWVVVDINTAWKDKTKDVTYIDADGAEQTATLTARDYLLGTTLPDGTYVAAVGQIQMWWHAYGEDFRTEKTNETTGAVTVSYGCTHVGGKDSNWREKVMYYGNTLIAEDIDAFTTYYTSCDVHGHILEKGAVTEPTCTEQGYTTYECTECDYTENKDYTEATGHTHIASETAPTCTEAGYTTYTCACGDSYKVDGEAALGHEIEVIDEQAATCTEAGYREEMCINCDYYDVIDIEATGHIYETEESVVDVDPTCTEAGYTKYICDICGDDSVVVPGDAATGHNFVAGEKVPATPSAQGYTVYTCENCGATENRDFVDYVEPSNKVSGVTVTPTDIGFKVTWDAFEGATGYYVRVRNSENTTNIANRDVGNVTEYEYKLGVNGFNASYDEEYIIQVIAYVGNVYQKYADADQVRSQMVITNRVVDVKATPYGHGAKVTFRPIEGATIYWVYVRNAADDSAVYTTSTTTTEVTVVNNMIGGTEYYVQIVAFSGNTQLDKRANAIKAKFVAPYVLPSKYNVAASTPTTFSITWDAVAGATTYFVQVRTEDDAPVRTVTVHNKTIAAVAMYSDASKLSVNTTYKFRIAATINGVTTGYGDWMTYTTGDYEPVTVTAEHNTETGKVKIAWTDLVDSHAVYLYRIDAEGNRKYFKYLENGETSYTIKAPASGTYSYGVVTVQRNMSGDCYNPIAVSEQIIFG